VPLIEHGAIDEVIQMSKPNRCKRCGSRIFFVDETCTYLEVDGEIIKQLGDGDLNNRNCVRCTYPELYREYNNYDRP